MWCGQVVSCFLCSVTDSMEPGQVDEVTDISVSPSDPQEAMVQEVKGHKVLATPAVRRLARENNVTSSYFVTQT